MEENKVKKRSQLLEIWKRLKKNKVAVAAMVFIALLILAAVFADVLYDYDTQVVKQNISERLKSPGEDGYPLGTDGFGRDILARIVHGSRISLLIGLLSTFISVLGGALFGSIAGYYGGRVDGFIMRVSDVFISIPAILLALAIVAALGQGMMNLIIALSVTQIPAFSRLMRSSILTIRESEFVEAARAVGTSDREIILRHIIPNTVGPLIVQATISIASAIIAAAGLSYVGLGVSAPMPEWGTMLSEGREFMRKDPCLLIIPGLAIVFTALSFNLLGDGLRDALDPRLKGGK